ncbi:hypothetical protein DFQ28_001201 [Apophysomyces sp. BC1034]|nr:hypothetical protein DFQ29_000737 [Apophysomyces sp. BC1021]KAG0190948.1 hypothetical protein DFQ28_001201 [Apophysomyces sp. BC1034]
MDQWQICVNQTIKARRARFAWKIILMAEGLRVETNVRSFHGLATLVDQIRRAMTTQDEDESVGLTIHSTPGFYAIWNEWCHPRRYILPQDYPIDISQEQTDSLVELYCRTPCCYAPRLPLIDTAEFMARYTGPPAHRPSALLVYAVCAMAARNAFQLHVWGNRPSYESPQYNIGKPLSIAYCLRARELLAESFDEPSLDNCQAALLLSYCSHQNGYPSVIYFYEWIAFTMAQQLGLYDSGRRLTRQENMLVWCLYYFNTWYRVLRGGTSTSLKWSQFFPHCPLPMVLPRPEKEEDLAEYYTQNMWVYFIELQLLRDDTMARFVAAQDIETNKNLLRDVQEMQCKLDAFYARLPSDWQQSQCLTERPTQRCCNDLNEGERYQVNISSFGQFCTQAVQVHLVYHKLLNYGDGYYRDLARRCLKRSLDLAKASKSYKYDFEMARTMVDLLEQNIPIS